MFGDKQFDNVGYPTPSSVPVDRACRTVTVPADAEWFGLLMGLMSVLTSEDAWQQFEGGISKEDAACYWQEMVDSMYASVDEGCPVDVRQNSVDPCILEKSSDGGVTWVQFADLLACPPVLNVKRTGQIVVGTRTAPGVFTFDPPDYAPPGANIWTDITPTAQMAAQTNDLCTAAANLANVFRQVYKSIGQSLNAQPGLGVADIAGEIADVVSAEFGVTFLAEFANTLAGSLFALQALFSFTNMDDKQFHEFVCIIKPTLSGSAGHWVVNGAALSTALSAKIASAGPLPWSFLNLIGTFFGADGLNLGTKTTAYASYDCTTGHAYSLLQSLSFLQPLGNSLFTINTSMPNSDSVVLWRQRMSPKMTATEGFLGSTVAATPSGYLDMRFTAGNQVTDATHNDNWYYANNFFASAAAALAAIREIMRDPTYTPTGNSNAGNKNLGTGQLFSFQWMDSTATTWNPKRLMLDVYMGQTFTPCP